MTAGPFFIEWKGVRTLPLYELNARAMESIPFGGQGEVRIEISDPLYPARDFTLADELAQSVSSDWGKCVGIVKSWVTHVHNFLYFIQLERDSDGSRITSLRDHTMLVSVVSDSRLQIDTASLWRTFDQVLRVKYVQDDYFKDENRELAFEEYSNQLRRAWRHLTESRNDSIRLIHRIAEQITLIQSRWSSLPPIKHLKSSATQQRLTQAPDEVVLLIHGIRTHAVWQEMVRRVLEEIQGIRVIPIKFGYFDAFRFWSPFFTRQAPIEYVRLQILNARTVYPNARLSIIAHSFGTYSISRILMQSPDLVLHRLVLCGCVIDRRFRWDYHRSQITTDVINDYGTRDAYPVLASCMSWGYGDTGRHAFGQGAIVRDRGHDFDHSDFFAEQFVRTFWKPWFESGHFQESDWSEKAPPTSWLLDILSLLPIRWIIVVLLIVLPAGLSWLLYTHYNTVAVDNEALSQDQQFSEPMVYLPYNQAIHETAELTKNLKTDLRPWESLASQAERDDLLLFTDRYLPVPQIFASLDATSPVSGILLEVEIRKPKAIERAVLRDVQIDVLNYHSVAPTFLPGASLTDKPVVVVELQRKDVPLPWHFHATMISDGLNRPFQTFIGKSLSITEDRDFVLLKIVSRDRGVFVFTISVTVEYGDHTPVAVVATTTPLALAFFSPPLESDPTFDMLKRRYNERGGAMQRSLLKPSK